MPLRRRRAALGFCYRTPYRTAARRSPRSARPEPLAAGTPTGQSAIVGEAAYAPSDGLIGPSIERQDCPVGTRDRWSKRNQRRLDEVGRQYLKGRWQRTRRVPVWVNVALAALGGAGAITHGACDDESWDC